MLCVIDVGGTFMKYALYDPATKQLSYNGKVPTPQTTQQAFLEAIDEICQTLPTGWEGIAMSLPGTIDTDKGYVRQGGSLRYNDRVYLQKLLSQRYGCPVSIENDARCAALAEMWQGNLKGIDNGLVLVLGTGLGGSVIINGQLYKGTHLFAGELSIVLTKDIRQYHTKALLGPQVGIPNLMNALNAVRETELDGIKLFAQMEAGDAELVAVLEEYLDQFAQQLFNFQMCYDPQRVLIGGGISQNDFFFKKLQERMTLFYTRLPIPIPALELDTCLFHNDANLIGAVKQYQTIYGQ
ncbi:ROK family protein [Enterococcus camelliae]|uniref:ROK family protein n=1 Tax=Enterococcus camelliae TaxID=453959 RepID=A0ABW5TKB4_9ENTE